MARRIPPPPPTPRMPDVLREPPEHSAPPTPPSKTDDGTLQQLGKVSAIGTSFAVTVAGGVFLGWALQKWAVPSWAPWPLIGGAIAGVIVAGVRFVKDAQRLNDAPPPQDSPKSGT